MKYCLFKVWDSSSLEKWRNRRQKGFVAFLVSFGFGIVGLASFFVFILGFSLLAAINNESLSLVKVCIVAVTSGLIGAVNAWYHWRGTEESYLQITSKEKKMIR